MASTKACSAALFLLGPLLLTAPVLAQSEVRGAVNKTAPYGIPPATFSSLTSNPTKQGTYSAGGFNISAAGSATSQINGWLLDVAVTADVPLKDAEAATNGSIDGSEVTEATVLSLLAPANLTTYDESKWKICVAVYPSINMTAVAALRGANATNGTAGACSSYLGEDCARQISSASIYNSKDQSCEATVSLSPTCAQYFNNAEGLGTAFYTIEDGRFYAFGSAPTSAGDRDAIAEAEGHVWPIDMLWVESSGASGGGFTQCLQANSSDAALPSEVGHPTSGSSRIGMATAHWQAAVVLAVAVIALV